MRLFLTDFDGVWTDGTVSMHADGSESIRFHVHDGMGVRLAQMAGVEVAVLSGRSIPAVEHRVRGLGVEEIHLGLKDKAEKAAEIVRARGLSPEETAAIGDDLLDLALYEAAGLRIAPPHAVAAVRSRADYITAAAAGMGALREACDLLCEARGFDFLEQSGAS